MHKAAIRAATSVYLRDTGVARHWRPEHLDHWCNLAFARLQADLVEANPDYYSDEQLITTAADGTYALTGLLRTFFRPQALTKKNELTDTDGIPYTSMRPRLSAAERPERTYFIRGGSSPILTVNPREAVNFALEYVYRPTNWLDLAESASPDFPEAFHALLASESAASAVTDGGKKSGPGAIAGIVGLHRQQFQAYLSRFNEAGPIQVEVTE